MFGWFRGEKPRRIISSPMNKYRIEKQGFIYIPLASVIGFDEPSKHYDFLENYFHVHVFGTETSWSLNHTEFERFKEELEAFTKKTFVCVEGEDA